MIKIGKAMVVFKPSIRCLDLAKSVSEALKSRGVEIFVKTVDDLYGSSLSGFDLIVSVGGDGTVLRIAELMKSAYSPPILPIPCGRRNIFYESIAGDLGDAVARVLRGDFYIQEYYRLSCCLENSCWEAFNEALVVSANPGKVTGFVIEVDSPGVFSRYRFDGDGVIVSTAQGSTAYNLSARGPLVSSAHPSIIITPLDPMELNLPPLVLPHALTKVKVSSRGYSTIYIDGEMKLTLGRGEEVLISGSKSPVRLIRFSPAHDIVLTTARNRYYGREER